MFSRGQRTGIALASTILSLPAFLTVFAGAAYAYLFATLGGYSGTVLEAVLKLLSSWTGCVTLILLLMLVVHVVVFIYLLVRFARGLPLPLLAQLFCLIVVTLVVAERVRLLIVDGSATFWFGVLSLPHVLCLFFVVWAARNSTQEKGVPFVGKERPTI